MTHPRLIALCSPAMGSGKSTVADHLVDQYGFVRVAFATPLKAMTVALMESIGMPEDDIQRRVYGTIADKEKPLPGLGEITSRRIMQTLGTDWGRVTIRDSIWVDIALVAAKSWMDAGRSVVIDDMRFPNEYSAVLLNGGECRRIVRPGTAVTVSHASEGQLDTIPMHEIWNGGTVEDLHAAVDISLAL